MSGFSEHADGEATDTFSVGFSLAPTYGTIAVSFANGTVATEIVYGDKSYREVMARLSLKSSRHLAPPYEDFGEALGDAWRFMLRRWRKSWGWPASCDVGALSGVISALRQRAQQRLGIRISAAVISTTHLVALYQDNLSDAFEHVALRDSKKNNNNNNNERSQLKYVTVPGYFPGVLWETASARAGHGLGLCANPTDRAACLAENERMPRHVVLLVQYTRGALAVALAEVQSVSSLWEPDGRHIEDFTLGWDASGEPDTEFSDDGDCQQQLLQQLHQQLLPNRDKQRQEKQLKKRNRYWDAVHGRLREVLLCNADVQRPDKVIVTGDKAHDATFQGVLRQALRDLVDDKTVYLQDDPVFVSAKGAAELHRRAAYVWKHVRDARASD